MPRKKKAAALKVGGKEDSSKDQGKQSNETRTVRKNDVLPINKQFAERYEVSKRKQLLSNVPAEILGDGSESSSSDDEEEDEFGELLTKRIDHKVARTLEAIRNRDPQIYDKSTHFFDSPKKTSEGSGSGSDSDSGEEHSREEDSQDEPVAGWDTIAKAAQEETPKMTLKDYVRETLLKDGKLSDSDDDQPLQDDPDYYRTNKRDLQHDEDLDRKEAAFYPDTEKYAVKETTKVSLDVGDDSGDGDDGDSSDGDFFQKKTKTAAEAEAEEQDFERFLDKQRKKKSARAGEDLLLHSYLENEAPDEKERFLRDFVLNNGWLDKNAAEAPAAGDYAIEVDVPEKSLRAQDDTGSDAEQDGDADDEFEDKADEFEAKYNFRFEEPDGNQVASHARTVPGSMRRPDDRRKRAREARRLRKEQEKLVKTEDIKRLKNLKRKEVEARLLAIQEAAGDGIDVSGIDLDGDFDPDEFNKEMEKKFGDEYYSQKDGEMKQLTKEGVATASERRLPARKSQEAPEDIREDVNKMMDEYYNLDYEDIVGGVPMRFNYKQVDPESFNLTAADILGMEDKELNKMVSLKYLAPYRANRDIKKQAWRVRDAQRKQRMSNGHDGGNEHHTPATNDYATSMSKSDKQNGHSADKHSRDSRKKRKRPTTKAGDDGNEAEGKSHEQETSRYNVEGDSAGDREDTVAPAIPEKKRRRKKKKSAAESISDLSASRKEAYSIK